MVLHLHQHHPRQPDVCGLVGTAFEVRLAGLSEAGCKSCDPKPEDGGDGAARLPDGVDVDDPVVQEKLSEITEDQLKKALEKVQDIHDKFIKNVDEVLASEVASARVRRA